MNALTITNTIFASAWRFRLEMMDRHDPAIAICIYAQTGRL
jgi:hypothetical protein